MTKADRQSSLEREIEETRERLAGTIDLLLYRASPKTIANRQVAAILVPSINADTDQQRGTGVLHQRHGALRVLRFAGSTTMDPDHRYSRRGRILQFFANFPG